MPPLLDPALPSAESPALKWGSSTAPPRRSPSPKRRPRPPARSSSSRRTPARRRRLSEEIAFFAGPGTPVRVFPDLETLPYDSFSAHPDITSGRLATLAELPRARSGVWLVAIDTLLQRLAPRSYIEALLAESARRRDAGSRCAARTAHPGGLRRRDAGGRPRRICGPRLAARRVPDGLRQPLPHRLLDRDVDSIRHFDPDTQRSGDKLDRIQLLPARETPLNPDAVREFRRRYRLRFSRRSDRATGLSRCERRAKRPGGWSSSCRCSSIAPRICSNICRRAAF